MRKRIVIAALALVVLSPLAYLLTQPGKGSVEYHKQKYLQAWNRAHERDWRSRLAHWLIARANVTSVGFLYPDTQEDDFLAKEVAFHRNALVRLGYLSETLVAFTNRSAVSALIYATNCPTEADERFIEFFFNRSNETNTIVVVSPTSTITLWEEYLRKLDVPEGVK